MATCPAVSSGQWTSRTAHCPLLTAHYSTRGFSGPGAMALRNLPGVVLGHVSVWAVGGGGVILPSMLNSATALRRWMGAFCLAVASGMLIWGNTLLQPYLAGNWFLVYWLVFLVFTSGAIGIGLLDFFALRHSLKMEQKEMLSRVLAEARVQDPPGETDERG